MTSSFKTKRLVESALMIALSAILSFIILFRLRSAVPSPPAVCCR